MINLKNLETLISEMDFGENIKVLSFDKIQVKRKDKSIANICSSFRIKEEYKKKEYNGYSVERKYVNSKAYHDKFEQLPVSKKVSESLYKQAGRLLEFVDGQEEERLLAVNGRTGDFLVDNFNRPGSADRTGFSYEEFQYVKNCPDSVILMHNHSRNGPPSAQDIIAYALDDKIKMSIILCHDGDVYTILKASKEVKKIYEDILERYKSYISDLSLAKKLASDALYKANKDVNEKFFEIGGL